jgi:hypothetical protein
VKSRFRIRINVIRIHNTVPDLVGCSGSDGSATFLASGTGTVTPFLIKMRRMGESRREWGDDSEKTYIMYSLFSQTDEATPPTIQKGLITV